MERLFQKDSKHPLNSCSSTCDTPELHRYKFFRVCPNCAYPKQYYPDVINLAIGACGSGCGYRRLRDAIEKLHHIDVVFTHYKVNNYGAHQVTEVPISYEHFVRFLLSHRSHPAVINLSMLSGSNLLQPH